MKRTVELGAGLPPVCRLGLASRGNTQLAPDDVHEGIEHGVGFLNWCGNSGGLSRAVAERARDRHRLVLSWQLEPTDADGAERALDAALLELGTDYLDIVTFYYVERESTWRRITGAGGAYEAMARARQEGKVRLLGLTSHQRRLAVRIGTSPAPAAAASVCRTPAEDSPLTDGHERALNLLMLRYNAAHRGAEQDVFPVTDRQRMPVIAYTCLRWGALAAPTPEDPPGFLPPPAREWYRFVLAHPSVAVALMAPSGRSELVENLSLLDEWRPPTDEERAELIQHAERVRRSAGRFP